MKRLHLLAFLAFALLSSCEREVFPKDDEIIGEWQETNPAKTADMLHRLAVTASTFSIISADSTTVSSYNYELEKKSGSILLTEPVTGGTAALELSYRRKDDQLGIFNLFIAIPEAQEWAWFDRID